MRKYLLIAVVALTSMVLLSCGGGKSKSTAPNWALLMLAEINANRPGNELEYDLGVAAVALAHAQWLQANQTLPSRYYSSTGSGGSTPSQRLTNAGITYISAGETGAYTNTTVQGAYAAMNTSTLTNPSFTHVGIAGVPWTWDPTYFYWVVTLVEK